MLGAEDCRRGVKAQGQRTNSQGGFSNATRNNSIVSRSLVLLATLVSVAIAASTGQTTASRIDAKEEGLALASDKAAHLNGVEFVPDADVGLDAAKPELSEESVKKVGDPSMETLKNNPAIGADSTGVMPAIVPNQPVTFYKATGQGSAVWYALEVRGVQFAVLEVDGKYPARIVNPNGVVVDVHREGEKAYPHHENVWATVTTNEGGYFLIPTALWNTLKQAKASDSQFSLPVSASNGRALIVNRVAFGEVLQDRVIVVSESSIVEDFFAMLTSEGTVVKDCLLTSARGYLKAKMQSYTDKGKFDVYRVCVYCLAYDAETNPAKTLLLGSEDFFQGTTPEELLASENLEQAFWERQHEVASTVFIPDSMLPYQSILVPLFDGSFYRLTDINLSTMIDQSDQGKVDQKQLFRKISTKEAKVTTRRMPVIIYNDKMYEVDLDVARELFYSHSDELDSDFQVEESENDLEKLVISSEDLEVWFTEGNQLPDLFIKETTSGISEGWPFIMRIEDRVLNVYYLNAKLVKVALSVLPKYSLEPIDQATLQFIKARQSNVHFQTQETPRNDQNLLEAKPWAQVSHKGKVNFIDQSGVKKLHSLGLENLFVNKRLLSGLPEAQLIKVGHEELVLNVGLMKELIETDNFESDDVRNTVRHYLGQSTSSHMGTQKTIQYNLQSYFTGTCDGKFVNESTCLGTFKGDYHHCKDPEATYPCDETKTPFVCIGKFMRKGCEGGLHLKIRLNHSTFDLVTEDFSPLALDQCGFNTTIERSDEMGNVTIHCSDNFHIQAQKCIGASISKVEILDKGNTKARTKILCNGSLDLNTLECASSAMATYQCHEPAYQNNSEICGDRFVRRTCASGGDFDGCYLYDPSDEEVICQGGIYDGKTCAAKRFYVQVDDTTFFTSSICTGKYVEGESCKGRFVGKVLSCPKRDDNETEIEVCGEEYAIGPISCDGTLTKDGCKGEYKGTTIVNDHMNFSVDASDTQTDFKDFKEGLVKLTFLDYFDESGEEEQTWKEISIECKGGYLSTGECKDANFVGSYRSANGWNLHAVRCHDTFDLHTYECKSGNAEVSHCLTDHENNELPFCRGTFKQSTCNKGATIFGCKPEDQQTTIVECVSAYWDGALCQEKEIIIVVNETRYITGRCSGEYVEHTSCDGSFTGGYVNCPVSYLTNDILCNRLAVENFICEGHLDKFGCDGVYSGFVHARGDIIKVTAGKHAKASSLGTISGSDIYLNFVDNVYRVKSKVKLGVDRELTGVCHRRFNFLTKECVEAELNFTNDYTPNTTYTRITCNGVLDIDMLSCTGGLMTLYSCNGSQTFPDNDRCLGIYHHLDCSHGGNSTACYHKTSNDVAIYCDGAYKNGHCSPFVVPQLPIIMVNSSYYVKGSCSSRITDNECRGIFTGSSVVNCTNSSALTVKQVFDACVPLSNEAFGTCIGLMNKNGCLGEYKTTIDINGSLWDFSSDDSSRYNLTIVQGMSKLIKQNRGADDKTFVALSCQDEFNMKALTCDKTILQFVDKSFSEKGPGIAQTISAVCFNSSFDIRQLACKAGEYLYYDCVGKSHKMIAKEGGITFTCLGDLKFSRCASGGQHNTCMNSGENDYSKECINSFFDGTTCLKDKEAENTEIHITSLGSYSNLDTDGQEVTIESFTVDKFHMFGATANQISLSENILDKIVLLNGTKKDDGSVVNIEMDQTPSKVSLDEGVLHRISFQDFALDELPYREFSINDDAQFIRVLFKNMIIHQFMFNNLSSADSVIRKLVVNDHTEVKNYGVDKLEISMGYGIIQLRDVEMYLPYIKNSTIEEWLSSPDNKINVAFNLPTVQDVDISPFKLRLQKEKNKIYLEFPQLSIEDRSLDIIKLEDYVLASTSFTSDPVAAETVIRNYEQFLREHPDEQEDAYEFSIGFSSEPLAPATPPTQEPKLNKSSVKRPPIEPTTSITVSLTSTETSSSSLKNGGSS